MKVLLVILVNFLDKIVYLLDILQGKLIVIGQSNYLQYFFLQHLLDTHRLPSLIAIFATQVGLEVTDQTFQFFSLLLGYATILSPTLSLTVEYLNSFVHKIFVGLTQVVVIIWHALLGPFERVKGLSEVFNFEVTNSHIH